MIQILKDDEVGTTGSSDPRFYYYIYVSNMAEAERVKETVYSAAELLCKNCRWAGYMNLKMVELLKYTEESN